MPIAALAPLGYATINLGAGRQAPLANVIHQIARLLGREAKIHYAAAHPDDLAATWADIEKARHLLGWQPEISLEEGLRRAVEWYRENRDLAATLNYGS